MGLFVISAMAGGAGSGARLVVDSTPAPSSVTLTVHGYGQGHGMGQYGALGYALDQGFTYQQILAHYYGTLVDGGSTTLGSLAGAAVGSTGLTSDSSPVTVEITANQGSAITVTSAASFTVSGGGIPAPVTVPGGGGAMFTLVSPASGAGSPTWSVFVTSGSTGTTSGSSSGTSGSTTGTSGSSSGGVCSAGTATWGTALYTGVTSPTATPVTAAPFPSSGAALRDATLELCQDGTHYRGSLGGAVSATAPSVAETVNTLPLGQYVADSAAAESPGDWGADGGAGPQGQAAGFQQTEAQVVATRSYAVAEAVAGGYGGVADICDSTACQAYRGITYENVYDDLAVADTASQVVLLPNGAVALTEYSASTGGYTSPGSGPGGFAGVVDAGDAVCTPQVCNPYHRYTVTIAASAVEAAFPQIGTFESLQVVQRNGLGSFGGRVQEVTLTGSAGSTTVTGNAFAGSLAGAASDHLQADGGTYVSSGVLSNWFAVQGHAASTPGYWLLGSDGGIFSFGSAAFYGSMGGTRLNEPVVGMAAVPGGGGYWEVASDGGIFSFGSAAFYGSTGAIHLDQPIVAMAPTPDGKGYWLLAADGGIFAFGDAGYFGSLPGSSIAARAVALLPTPDGQGYLIVESSGKVVPYGDAESVGDVPSAVPGYQGTVVGGADVPG